MSVLTQPQPVIPLLTADELDQFPNDGKRREIIGGVLYVAASPAREHQHFLGWLYRLVYEAAEETGLGVVYLGPVDVRFSERDQVQPDLLLLLNDHLDHYRGHVVHGPPNLVVEIASPSTRRFDEVEKAALYAAGGVPEYWQATPPTPNGRRPPAVRILTLRDGDYAPVAPDADGRVRSTIVPGLLVDPSKYRSDRS